MIRNENREYEFIKDIVRAQGYEERLAFVLCRMLGYMRDAHWRGGCHAACSVLYVALTELGYHVELCLGEVKAGMLCFDHSWLLLDGKVIDLAVTMIPAGGSGAWGPVILDTDIGADREQRLCYGIYRGGLDKETENIKDMPFVEYMDNYPKTEDGLWGVLKFIIPEAADIGSLREKYQNTERHYIYGMESKA